MEQYDKIASYNQKFTKLSDNSAQNMPCGGFDTGLNIWAQPDGIYFYIDRSGSFDENNMMLKLGRVRLRFEPDFFTHPELVFSQTLNLPEGRINIEATCGDKWLHVSIWCACDRPGVFIDVRSNFDARLLAEYQSWRTQDRIIPPEQRLSAFSVQGFPGDIITRADRVRGCENGVIFCHQNQNQHNSMQITKQQLGLEDVDFPYNPQQDYIFGGKLFGEDLQLTATTQGTYAEIPYTGWVYASPATQQHQIYVALHSDVYPNVDAFEVALENEAAQLAACRADIDTKARRYWQEFWGRSHIYIPPGVTDNEMRDVVCNYNLFRYMLGCNPRGTHPTKFNGGLFTTDACYSVPGHPYGVTTPDFRIWGGGSATAQNQRLVYWPMLKSADFDLMPPQFEFYLRCFPNAKLRSNAHYGHDGVAFCEQGENYGLPIAYEWGYAGSQCDDAHEYMHARRYERYEPVRPWVKYHYSTQLEFCYMILQYHRYSGQDITRYAELIDQSVRFFNEHYRRRHHANTGRETDQNGHLVLFPSSALETYKGAHNPADLTCALRAVLGMMLHNPCGCFSSEQLESYEAMLATIPPLYYRTVDGKTVIAPAKSFTDIINMELPQLYPVYPYEEYGLGRPDLQTAIDTYYAPPEIEGQRDTISWHQDVIFAARLGLVDEAVALIQKKLGNSGRPFPAYWGPGHDWTPDHNWGGSGMIALQEMLLQEVDGKLYLFPAWPLACSVDMCLHASGRTMVQAVLKQGKLESLHVTPPERAADIVLPATIHYIGDAEQA